MAKVETVVKIVPALTARTQLGQILRRVRKNRERFVVDRRGEPQAVIMSVEDYLKNFVKRPGALQQIQREAKARRLDRLTLREINLEVGRYRRAGGAPPRRLRFVTAHSLFVTFVSSLHSCQTRIPSEH